MSLLSAAARASAGLEGAENLRDGILSPEEPLSYQVLNPGGAAPVLLVCDHASNRIPQALEGLGISEHDQARHIAYDIGIAEVTRHLALALECPAVFCQYSRLVVDCNRYPHDDTAMPEKSDGTIILGNVGLSEDQRAARRRAIAEPYHQAIRDTRDALCSRLGGRLPLILAMHSFTPCLKDGGCDRPWQIGLLWNQDGRLFSALSGALQQQGWCVGDNQPYSGREIAYTLNVHAEPGGFAHVGIEIRQDLIATSEGAKSWAAHLALALKPLLTDETLLRPVRPGELSLA